MAVKQTPREFLSEFIELYKSLPCLWLVKSKEYSDRNKKDLAYSELVEKFQEFDPSADRNTVVKKINALRTVYKKEVTKVINSEKSGSGADDIYKPTLWYFDLLHFLKDQDLARPSRSTMSDADHETQQEDSEPTDPTHSQQGNVALTTSGDDGSSTSRSVTPSPITRPKRKKAPTPADEVIQLAGEQLKSLRRDDEFEAYGKYIAHKLRSLQGTQAIFARKLINDVIFEGELGTLNKNFEVVNSQPQRSFESVNQIFNPKLDRQQPPLYTSRFTYANAPTIYSLTLNHKTPEVSANVTLPNVQTNHPEQPYPQPYTSQMPDDRLSRSHSHITHPQQPYPRSSIYNTPPLYSQTLNPDTHEASTNVAPNSPDKVYSEPPKAHQPSKEPTNQSKAINVSAFFSDFSA